MNKLPIHSAARVQSAAGGSIKTSSVRAGAKARPSADVFASLHLLGKTVMVAVEVVEIVGFGLAVL